MKRTLCALLIGSTLLAGCHDSTPAIDGSPKMELRTYEVPAADTDAIRSTLNQLLLAKGEKDSRPFGAVASPGPGQLVILAPASMQDSIRDTLKSIKPVATVKPTTTAQQLQLNYWSVDAVPGAGADDANVGALAPALAELHKQLGDVHFVEVNHVSGVSSPGQEVTRSFPTAAGSSTSMVQLHYTLDNKPQGLMLAITYGDSMVTGSGMVSGSGSTTISVRLGQILALGQNPGPPVAKDGTPSPTKATRIHIVRVDEVSAN